MLFQNSNFQEEIHLIIRNYKSEIHINLFIMLFVHYIYLNR